MTVHRPLLIGAFAAALGIGGALSAHPRLIGTIPMAKSVTARPNQVQLKFNEKLLGGMTGADVLMVGMPGKPSHPPMKMPGFAKSVGPDGETIILKRAAPLSAGTYRVNWHAVSVDTHRVAGSFSFGVK